MGEFDMRQLDALSLAFFDCETTGLSLIEGHRICEVAVLRIRGTLEEQRIDTLINPGRALDPSAAAVNGLHDEMLQSAPIFADIAPALLGSFAGALLIAHNLPFDLAFLNAELQRIGRPAIHQATLDTLALSRRLLRRSSYSLSALAKGFDVVAPTHRAMDDVVALAAVFRHLRNLMADLGVTTVAAAQRLERGFLPGMAEPEPPPMLAEAIDTGVMVRIRYRSRSSPEATERTIRPLYLTQENSGVHLRAFCTLRNDVRSFALTKIELLELITISNPSINSA